MNSINEHNMFEALYNMIPLAVYIVDITDYKIIYVNQKMQDMAGESDLVGRTCYRHIFKSEQPCVHCRIGQLLENDSPESQKLVYELFNEANDGWYQMQEMLIDWVDGRKVKYALAVDINNLKKTENSLVEAHADLALKNKELERLYVLDSLTGAYNRIKLDELIEQELKRYQRYKRPFSIVIIDIDDFKDLNDTMGHLVGDEVLQELAVLLQKNTRETDLVCRWGGEEFVVVSPETDAMGLKLFAENIRELVCRHGFSCNTQITVSLGGTTVADEQDTHDQLFARADKALYAAKAEGKNRCCFF